MVTHAKFLPNDSYTQYRSRNIKNTLMSVFCHSRDVSLISALSPCLRRPKLHWNDWQPTSPQLYEVIGC